MSIVGFLGGVYTDFFHYKSEENLYYMNVTHSRGSRSWCDKKLKSELLKEGFFNISFCIDNDDYNHIWGGENVSIKYNESVLGKHVIDWEIAK